MTETPEDLRRDAYVRARADLLKKQLSNSENYDKSILSLSMASLGFSIGFLREWSRPICASQALWWSWGLFIAAIVCTMLSFLISQRAIAKEFAILERIRDGVKDAEKEVNWPARVVGWLAYGAGLPFAVAIVLTAVFAYHNEGGHSMSKNASTEQPATASRTVTPTTTNKLAEGREQRGAHIAPRETVRPSGGQSSGNQPAATPPPSQSTAGDKKKP